MRRTGNTSQELHAPPCPTWIPAFEAVSKLPLSLWERIGVREPRGKQAGANGNGWERQGYWGPSPGLRPPSPRGRGVGFGTVAPAFGHPLPEGEGLGLGRSHRPSATLSQRERGWVWDGSHRPSATLSQRERGFDTACSAGMTISEGLRLSHGQTLIQPLSRE